MRAAPGYRRLCKNGDGRTVVETMDICGPCYAAGVMPKHRPLKIRHSQNRRAICKHCGKERQVNGRDLCQSRCAKLNLDYPVVRGRGRKAAGQ